VLGLVENVFQKGEV